jgi:Recombination endonuclease VII
MSAPPDPVIKVPSKATLAKYGLTAAEWGAILEGQGGVCPICEKVPGTGRIVTDHEHAPGWKKMPPARRKLYVRGLCCWFCNHAYLGRGITVRKAENAVRYLKNFEARRPL